MTIKRSARSGLYVKTGAIATNPAPQLSQDIVLSATVDSVTCQLIADPYKGCGYHTFSVNGVGWVATPLSHGQGVQYADNFIPTGYTVANNANSPTEGGNVSDGSTLVTGTSNNTYRALSADGRQLVRATLPAYWGKPYQITNVYPSLNNRLVAGNNPSVQHTIWGWNGDDHVIQFLRDVYVPDDVHFTGKQQLDCVSCSIYATDTLFGSAEYLNPATGATRTYPGFPDTSQTEITMISSADGTRAMATYQPLGEWGATGYAQHWATTGLQNVFVRAREVVANITPGVRRYNAYLVFGSRGQVIASVLALHAANITRAVNIQLPDLAA